MGQSLIIPTRVGGTHNSASTFKPYDPSGVVGNTTPNLPQPSSGGGDDGCGTVLKIVRHVRRFDFRKSHTAPIECMGNIGTIQIYGLS